MHTMSSIGNSAVKLIFATFGAVFLCLPAHADTVDLSACTVKEVILDCTAVVTGPVDPGLALAPSGPITTTQDDQVIEGLHVTGQVWIKHDNVILRNMLIEHSSERPGGLVARQVKNLLIEDVSVKRVGAPPSGPLADKNERNIFIEDVQGAVLNRIYTEDGSVGIFVTASDSVTVSGHQAVNPRGPFSHGQGFATNLSNSVLYEDFSIVSDRSIAWTADNVSVFQSSNVTVRKGIIDGNNDPSGGGVTFEQATGALLCQDVDVNNWSVGAFIAWDSDSVVFERANARSNSAESWQDRGPPSNGPYTGIRANSVFSIRRGSENVRVLDSKYWDVENPAAHTKIYAPSTEGVSVTVENVVEENYTPRDSYIFVPTWD